MAAKPTNNGITEQEGLAEMAGLTDKNSAGQTAWEMAESSGRSTAYIQKMLKRAKKAGWLVLAKQTREGLDGRAYQANVYRVVKPKK